MPASGNREVINGLLTRAKRFHCSVSTTAEYDVTALRERLRDERRAGRELSLSAYLVKATARLIEEQPHLNRHVFTGLLGNRRVVEFQDIRCTLIVARRSPAREEVLFPVVLPGTNHLSLDEIEREIRKHKTLPFEELPQLKAMQRVKRMPRVALELFSYKARSDPDFYLRYFGSYGLSSVVRVGGHGVSASVPANTCVAFLPGTLRKLPRLVDGRVEAREILSFGLTFDHYLIDGIQMLRAVERLGALLERPSLLLGDD